MQPCFVLLAEEGAVAVIVDRDAEAGEKLCAELRHEGMRCFLVSTELASAENCSHAVEQTIREFGQLDAVINNAGVNDRIGLEHGSPEQYVDSLQKNLLHYYNIAHYALPHLKHSKGSIVNICLEDGIYRAGRNIRLHVVERSNSRFDAGVGCRIASL